MIPKLNKKQIYVFTVTYSQWGESGGLQEAKSLDIVAGNERAAASQVRQDVGGEIEIVSVKWLTTIDAINYGSL